MVSMVSVDIDVQDVLEQLEVRELFDELDRRNVNLIEQSTLEELLAELDRRKFNTIVPSDDLLNLARRNPMDALREIERELGHSFLGLFTDTLEVK